LPDMLTHFAVAFAFTAPFLGISKAILAGVIAVTPDVDVFSHVHRSITHSVIVLLVFALPIAYLAYKMGVGWRTSA